MEPTSEHTSKKVWIIVGSIAGLCLLGVIALVIVVTMMGRLMSKSIGVDSASAAKIAHEITDYDLPSGYVETMSINILTTRMVYLAPTDLHAGLYITLAEFGSMVGNNSEEMQRQLERAFQQQTNQQYTGMQEIERRPLKVRGSDTEAVVREGSGADGTHLRQLYLAFPGKKGLAMLMISGSREQWDEDLIYTFIASFR